MSSAGLDTAVNCQTKASSIKNAGYDFVCRYYNVNDSSKNLTYAEGRALSIVGLSIVAVWENGYPTSDSYFTYSKGYSDGTAAYNYAKNTITQQLYTPIYFAVDYDATSAAISSNIVNYFKGVADAFTSAGGNYGIGVYGSGAVCNYIYTNVGPVGYTWLAGSASWSGYNTFTTWNIKQGSGITVAGVQCDSDTGASQIGGFTI